MPRRLSCRGVDSQHLPRIIPDGVQLDRELLKHRKNINKIPQRNKPPERGEGFFHRIHVGLGLGFQNFRGNVLQFESPSTFLFENAHRF